MSKHVLILCTGNSARSQMAEGLWAHHGRGQWQAASAGSDPAGFVHPLAIKAMAEIEVDISGNESKHLDQFLHDSFDVVVTVCDNAAKDCPVFSGAAQLLHWPFDDPSHVEGSEEERLSAFRETRNQISARIRQFLDESNAS